MAEALFKDHAPEAAARQLAVVLASATEEHLATLEKMQKKARVAKSEITAQEELCRQMVFHCKELGVEPQGLRGRRCERLAAAMEKE